MKVFVAGANGAIGRSMIECLTRDGYRATAMIRTPATAYRMSATTGRGDTGDRLEGPLAETRSTLTPDLPSFDQGEDNDILICLRSAVVFSRASYSGLRRCERLLDTCLR